MKLNIQGSNATVIEVQNKTFATSLATDSILFSYSTPVAAIIDGKKYRTDISHSKTTQKHITQFFGAPKTGEEKPQEWFDGLLAVSLKK